MDPPSRTKAGIQQSCAFPSRMPGPSSCFPFRRHSLVGKQMDTLAIEPRASRMLSGTRRFAIGSQRRTKNARRHFFGGSRVRRFACVCWCIGGDAQVCMRVSVTAMTIWIADAAIAQLGERQTEDLKVPGSIPGLGTFASCVCDVRCPLRTSNRHLFGMILRDPQFLMSWLVCWFCSCLRAAGKQ